MLRDWEVNNMKRRQLTLSESIDFNIYIDKLGITNREIYRAILEDYLDGYIKLNYYLDK